MKLLSCELARQFLGASRRDDWTTEELGALAQHLESCPACRKAQAEYREVGELVRQLPSLAPPPSFRASVYAAVQADQQRIRRRQAHGAPSTISRPAALARLATADTDPALVAVHVRSGRALPPAPPSRRVMYALKENTRVVAALAAMLLVALLGVTLVPASPFFLFASGATSLAQYTADARVAHVSSAGASSGWVVYAGPASSGGGNLLFVQSRQGGTPIPITPSSSSAPISVYGVTGSWAIWGASDSSGWNLAASMLPSGQTTALLDSSATGPGAAIALHGVWTSENRVLAAVTTRVGTSLLLQFDLSSGAPAANVLVRASAGTQLADPSFDGTNYYWSQVTQDASGTLHSTIWRGTDGSHAQQAVAGGDAFAPVVTTGALIWVAATNAPKVSNGDFEAALSGATGAMQEESLASGQQAQLGANVTAGTLQAGDTLVLWQSGGKTYTYDLATHAASHIESQIRDAAVVGLTSSVLVWAQANSSTLDVYTLK
ncbi:MAG TPA: hypothetical protein VF120_06760 [Ktedonobacterales bacterium]